MKTEFFKIKPRVLKNLPDHPVNREPALKTIIYEYYRKHMGHDQARLKTLAYIDALISDE